MKMEMRQLMDGAALEDGGSGAGAGAHAGADATTGIGNAGGAAFEALGVAFEPQMILHVAGGVAFEALGAVSVPLRVARRRSQRYLCALLSGALLLSPDWLTACAKEGFLQDEAPFAVSCSNGDISEERLRGIVLAGRGRLQPLLTAAAAAVDAAPGLAVGFGGGVSASASASVGAAGGAGSRSAGASGGRGRSAGRGSKASDTGSGAGGGSGSSGSGVFGGAAALAVKLSNAAVATVAAGCAASRARAVAAPRLRAILAGAGSAGSSSSSSGSAGPSSGVATELAAAAAALPLMSPWLASPAVSVSPSVAVPLFAGLTIVCWGEFECPPKNVTATEVVELAALGGAAEVVTELRALNTIDSDGSITRGVLKSKGLLAAAGEAGASAAAASAKPSAAAAGDLSGDEVAWRGLLMRRLTQAGNHASISVPPIIVLCDHEHWGLPACLVPLIGSPTPTPAAAPASLAAAAPTSAQPPRQPRLAVMVSPDWLIESAAAAALLDVDKYLHGGQLAYWRSKAGATGV